MQSRLALSGVTNAGLVLHTGWDLDLDHALELRGITKSFGSVQALTEVDFEVRDGEVMALVGDNGAGKSTLIKCVAGIYSIDSGEVLFEGSPVSIHGPKDAARRRRCRRRGWPRR